MSNILQLPDLCSNLSIFGELFSHVLTGLSLLRLPLPATLIEE